MSNDILDDMAARARRNGQTAAPAIEPVDSDRREWPEPVSLDAERLKSIDARARNWALERHLGERYLRELREQEATGDVQTPITPIGSLMEQFPQMDPVIVDELLRLTELATLIAPSKAKKSWLVISLLLSITTGRNWLGRFPCLKGTALLIDNELRQSTIAKRVHEVAEALKIQKAEYKGRLDVVSLRGRQMDIHGLARIVDRIERGKYTLIALDALYRFLPSGFSESSNADMTQFFNVIDSYAEHTGAAWVCVHHSSKGLQGEKSVVDVGSGAGAIARCPDSHLALREHEQDGVIVLESALRSFPPLDPVPLRWAHPIWTPADDVDASKLKGRLTRNEQRQTEKDAEGIKIIVDGLLKGPATVRELRRRCDGMGGSRCERLLSKLEASGDVSRTSEIVRGNECWTYQLTDVTRDA